MSQEDKNVGSRPASKRERNPKQGIDWTDVYRRLESYRAAAERGAPSLDEKRKILQARARLLAREAHDDETSAESVDILEFVLASERYGIELDHIREVYPLTEFTPVPCTPAFVLGVVNVRGQILSVIDIKKFFDLPEKGLTDLNKVIIVQGQHMELGILADVVVGVKSVALSEIQPSLPTLTGIRAVYLRGIAKGIAILDVVRILGDEKIVVNESVEETA